MTPRFKRRVTCVLATVVCMLCAGSASAELIYLWKTNQCPILPDKGAAKSYILGVMQAPVVEDPPASGFVRSVGGPFCDLVTATKSTSFGRVKFLAVNNADIIKRSGDPGVGEDGSVWDCILCNYTELIRQQFPTMSLLGTAILLGGLLTAAAYELRRRQGRMSAA